MKPNHHYSTHSAEYIRDFGPAAGFWTFIFERLNKTLKSHKHNNHRGGIIETTWFNAFLKAQWVQCTVSSHLHIKQKFTSLV